MSAPTPPELAAWFERKLGAPFPLGVPSGLVAQGEELWVSPSVQGLLTEPPMTPEFLAAPSEYALAGLWGRGINSYAFYLVDVRGPHRRFFRLPLGNAYGKWEDEAREVVAYLRGYELFRSRFEAGLEASKLLHNMGTNLAELTWAGKPPVTLRSTGREAADWWADVSAAVEQAG